MRRVIAIACTVGALIVLLGGCTMSPTAPTAGPDNCLPSFFADPERVPAGTDVVITASDDCHVDPPDDGWEVTVSAHGGAVIASVTSTARLDGDFTATLTVPADAVPGEYVASIANWDYSACERSGASCAMAGTSFVVTEHAG